MFVPIVEGFFKVKIDGIIRNPQSKEDYIHDAQLTIDCLSELMKVDLTYITGEMIWEGNREAISNLVSIFLRLLKITGSNESLKSLGSNYREGGEEEEFNRRFSYPSGGDSISTKDSLLLPKPSSSVPHHKPPHHHYPHTETTPRRTRPNYYYERDDHRQRRPSPLSGSASPGGTLKRKPQIPKQGTKKILTPTAQKLHKENHINPFSLAEQRFTQRFLNESYHRSEKMLQSDLKQYHAQNRRKITSSYQKNYYEHNNRLKERHSQKMIHKKWQKDQLLQKKSYLMKNENAEIVALHQIYQALFREIIRRKAEDKRDEQRQILQLKRKLENEVEVLDRSYREKLRALREQEGDPHDRNRQWSRLAYEDVLNDLSMNLQSRLERQSNVIHQHRERELLWKKEACDRLLSSIHGRKWEDYLRVYPSGSVGAGGGFGSATNSPVKKKVRSVSR